MPAMAIVAIDVRNSLPWEAISPAMVRGNISPYIRRIVMDYLNERTLVFEDAEYKMSMGVPQGSVLVPILWNLAYDGILRIPFLNGVSLTAYADDVLVIVKAT